MDSSERTLALVIVAAIVVSLGGTIVSLNELGKLSFTGYQTSTASGEVRLNITSQTTISITRATINFGNGYVNNTCSNCTMNTNSNATGSNYSTPFCCLLDWDNLGPEGATGLWVQNQGNTNLTVSINFSANASVFIGGSNPDPLFQFKVMNDSNARTCTGNCTAPGDDTSGSCIDPGPWNYSTAFQDVNTTELVICSNEGFKPISTQDEFVVDIRVRVPRTASASQKVATVTFTGTSS